MNIRFIESLIEKLQGSSITNCDYEANGAILRLRFSHHTGPGAGAAEPANRIETRPGPDVVRAPFSGVFQAAHPLNRAPMAVAGEVVSPGQVLGILCMGHVFHAVVSPRHGVLGRRLQEDGTLVGYGQPLFEIEEALVSQAPLKPGQ